MHRGSVAIPGRGRVDCEDATLLAMSHPERYAELGTERDQPPYFAGRGSELSSLHKRLDRLCETGDPRSGMSLIVGALGVGKTQLGLRFSEQAAMREAGEDVRRLDVDTVLLESEIDLFLAMARALDAEREFRKADMDTEGAGHNGLDAARGRRTREHVRRHTGICPRCSVFPRRAAHGRAKRW